MSDFSAGWLEQLSELEHLKASWERRETNSFQPYRKAVTDSASALIELARRAEELEREREMLEAVRHSAEKVMGAYLHAGHVDVDDMDSLYIALRDAR